MIFPSHKFKAAAVAAAFGGILAVCPISARAEDAASLDCMAKLHELNKLRELENVGAAVAIANVMQLRENSPQRRAQRIEEDTDAALMKAIADYEKRQDALDAEMPAASAEKHARQEQLHNDYKDRREEIYRQRDAAMSDLKNSKEDDVGTLRQWLNEDLPQVRKAREAAEADYRDSVQRQREARHEQPSPQEDVAAFLALLNLADAPDELLVSVFIPASHVFTEPEKTPAKRVKRAREREEVEEPAPRHDPNASMLETAAGIAIGIELGRRSSGGSNTPHGTTGQGPASPKLKPAPNPGAKNWKPNP